MQVVEVVSCSLRLRNQVLKLQGKRCWICGMPSEFKGTLEMHRLIPGREGGSYVMGNVVGLCEECHRTAEGLNAEQLYNLSPYGLNVGRTLSIKYFAENNLKI